MKYYEFPCGCKFPIMGKLPDGRPQIKFSPKMADITLFCDRTWDLISSGNTKGCFQLESRHGQSLAAKLKPRNMEHLSALMSIMRPGCTDAVRDGKSVTDHYIDRKNGVEPVTYIHPSIQKILEPTYGELIYQEQAMQIVQVIANFSLQQADVLRKAIGKKKPEEMAKVKLEYDTGIKEVGIVDDEAKKIIWDNIEASQRYSFNKSHSISYAFNAYLSAYAKAHFPRVFFTSYLYHAKGKAKPHQEINELVNNARLMDVNVCPPDYRELNKHFRLIDKNIYFGFIDIKGVGESMVEHILRQSQFIEKETGIPRADWTWMDFLTKVTPALNSVAVKAIICSSSLAYMGEQRSRMLFEYATFLTLSKKELIWVGKYVKDYRPTTLEGLFEVMIQTGSGREAACANKKRLEKLKGLLGALKNPPHSMTDMPVWIAEVEQNIMGIPITCTVVDSCDKSAANCTCREFINGSNGRQKIILIAAKVEEVKEVKTRRGKNPGQKMGFLTVSDETGILDSIVIFPEEWATFQNMLFEDNTIMISGERSRDKDSLVVKKIWQI